MDNLEIYNNSREVPQEAQKTIQGGRLKGKTDINPMWRIKKLTELFGPCGIGWYYKTIRKWTENVGDEVAAFVDIELYYKQGDQWSMPVCGTGGSMLAEKEKGGLHISDECYKMATTDAISVSCKQLGIGADVYWSADRTKYDSPMGKEEENKKSSNRITEQQMDRILDEMERTGVTFGQIQYVTKKKSLEQLVISDYEMLMKMFKDTADKVPPPSPNDPPDIPDDELLPFK